MNTEAQLEPCRRADAPLETEPARSERPPGSPSRLRAFAVPFPDQFSAVFAGRSEATSELLLLPDGRILAHHLTPELATVLHAATAQ